MKTNGLLLIVALGFTTGCYDNESDQGSETTPGVVDTGEGNGTDTDNPTEDQGYLDSDRDGFPSNIGCVLGDDDCIADKPDEGESDCNDDDPNTHPDADELCDGIDNDCNGSVDDNPVDADTFYVDGDSDSYGDEPVLACEMPSDAVERAGDCNDADGNVHPGSVEVCDGFDNDCNGTVDDAAVDANTYYTDADSDGFGDAEVQSCTQPAGASEIGGDCDDTDGDVNPDARETAVDGVDTDCDGSAMDAETSDTDGDGTNDYLDSTVVTVECSNINAYHTVTDLVGESDWSETSGWWGSTACTENEGAGVETMVLVDTPLPDQDVWEAVVTGSYATAVSTTDDADTAFGMVFGYQDDDNYSVVWYSEESELLVFERYVSGSLNEYESTSASGLSTNYLAEISVAVVDDGGTPMIEIEVYDLINLSSITSMSAELDSFEGNLEGYFGLYSSDGMTQFDGGSSAYNGSFVSGADAP